MPSMYERPTSQIIAKYISEHASLFFTMTFLQVCVMLFRHHPVNLLLASSMNYD